MAISHKNFDAANRRAVQTKAKYAVATKVRFDVRRKAWKVQAPPI